MENSRVPRVFSRGLSDFFYFHKKKKNLVQSTYTEYLGTTVPSMSIVDEQVAELRECIEEAERALATFDEGALHGALRCRVRHCGGETAHRNNAAHALSLALLPTHPH